MRYATQDGSPVDEDFFDEITEKIGDLFGKLQEEATQLEEEDKSVGGLLQEAFETFLSVLTSEMDLDNGQVQLVRAIFEARLKEEKNDTACSDLNQLSAKGWNAFEESSGDNMIVLKYGYGALVDHLKSKLPEENILLNEVVSKIDYSSDNVIISTKNRKSGNESEFSAKYCICTVPLGYLKANHKDLFEPSLPSPKAKAIQKLGFGLVDKIFLVFDSQPFEDNAQGFQILWRNDLNLSLKSAKKWSIVSRINKSTFNGILTLVHKRYNS